MSGPNSGKLHDEDTKALYELDETPEEDKGPKNNEEPEDEDEEE